MLPAELTGPRLKMRGSPTVPAPSVLSVTQANRPFVEFWARRQVPPGAFCVPSGQRIERAGSGFTNARVPAVQLPPPGYRFVAQTVAPARSCGIEIGRTTPRQRGFVALVRR